MRKTSRLLFALTALTVAFTASVTYKLGRKGWRFELVPSTARALDSDSPLYHLRILSRVIHQVHSEYVDPERVRPKVMLLEALAEVERQVPQVIIRPGPGEPEEDPAALEVVVGRERQVFDVGDVRSIFLVRSHLQKILRYLGEHLEGDPDVKARDVEYAAINGMLSTLDPHSIHMEPEVFKEMKVSTRGSFGGLGIVISIRDGHLTIISPIEDTPASRAGLKAKDKIVRINDESTVNMRLNEAVDRLRGEVDTTVTIWVLRDGWSTPRKYVLRRAIIQIRSVSGKLLEGGVGGVKVKNFQENTTGDLRKHVEDLEEANGGSLKGLVLDLRNNPGGLLGQAIRVSDLFLDAGTIVKTVGAANKEQKVEEASWRNTVERYPMVVLVNGGSASASEIVAGALKQQDRAIVLGEQSFGKGSVQVLYPFKEDGSALKLTVAQYLTPGDLSIQSVGIVPDVVLIPVRVGKEEIRYYGGEQGVREADLDEHLVNEAARAEVRPSYRMHYFEEPEPPETEGAEEEPPDPGPEKEEAKEPDWEVLMARDLLATIGGSGLRREMLRNSSALLARVQKGETDRIGQALAGLDVDWTAGENKAGNTPVVKVALSAPDDVATAGDMLEVTATVENHGDAPLHRLRAVSETDCRTLDDLEFVFGLVPPGGSRSWTTKVEIPSDEDDRRDDVRLDVFSGDGATPLATTEFGLRTQALPRPHFRWAWQVDDSEHGNGDGRIQRGETVSFLLHVDNVGGGPALEGQANLGLEKDGPRRFVDLKTGRSSLGELPVDKTHTSSFSVEVRSGLQPDSFKAELSISDRKLLVGVRDMVDVPVERGKTELKPWRGAARVNVKPIPVRAGCGAGTHVLGQAPKGTWLTANGRCGGWLRIREGDRYGFVQASAVKTYKGRKPSRKGPRIDWNAWKQAPRVVLDPATVADHHPDAATLHLKGEVTDDDKVLDIAVYVRTQHGRRIRSRKAAYLPAKGDAKQMSIDLSVPLFEGLNRVVVVARDGERLTTRQTVVVHRRVGVPALSGVTGGKTKEDKAP